MVKSPDHWEGEDAIFTIEEEGKDVAINFEGKISGIEIGGGTESTENTYLFGGKTIVSAKPREKFTVSLDFLTTDAFFNKIHFGTAATNTNTLLKYAGTEMRSSDVSLRYRVILWFQPASQHQANSTRTIIVPNKLGNVRRFIFCDCRSVEVTHSFAADGMLSGKINFELSATDESGFANLFDEWVSSTTTALTVLTTTAHKGLLTYNATTPAWTASYRT